MTAKGLFENKRAARNTENTAKNRKIVSEMEGVCYTPEYMVCNEVCICCSRTQYAS